MKPAVVFDFDGTIADTFGVVTEIFYGLTHRKQAIAEHEQNRLRGMSLPQVARELRVPVWKVPFLVMRGRRQMAKRINEVPLFESMPAVLSELHSKGYPLYIVSSNSGHNVRLFLAQHGITNVFTRVYGDARLFGKDRLLRHIQALGHERLIYVGDETRDIEAAKRAGAKSIAVAWGYNNAAILKRHNPDKLVFEPSEITGCIENNEV
jgi:phosphoglycolate phosphatase